MAADPPVARQDRGPAHVRWDNDHDVESPSGPLEEWGKLIGDVPAATAILDSPPHHAEIITLKGRSYRPRDRAGKAEAATKEAATQEAVVPSEREGTTPCRRKPK